MKGRLLIVWALAVCLALGGCARQERSAAVLLGEQMARAEGLPAGQIYHSDAAEGEEGYFSPRLVATVYGEEAQKHCFPLIEEYAIYLSSFAEPCEIAVFRCYAGSDTDRIAEMCLARTEELRILLAGTPLRARADAATVRVEGKVVILQMLP